MARGSGSSGGGATDKVQTAATYQGSLRTWSLRYWINAPSAGIQSLFFKGTGGSSTCILRLVPGDLLSFSQRWTAGGIWNFPLAGYLGWHSIQIVYDAGDPANVPFIWQDAVAQTLVPTPPTGAVVTDLTPWLLFNRADSLRVLDGMLADVAMWSVLLPTDEVLSLAAGVAARLIHPADRVFDVPMYSTIDDYANAIQPTVTGTLSQTHPVPSILPGSY